MRSLVHEQVIAHSLEWAEGALAGLVDENVAYLDVDEWGRSFVDDVFAETTVINYAHTFGEANGNFTPDHQHPGIPGNLLSTDNYQSDFVTYLRFDAPGLYTMGVNSDDNFRVTLGDQVGRQYLEVLAPAGIAGGVAAVPSVIQLNANLGGPLPTTPIEGDVVYLGEGCRANPEDPNPITEDLTGKVALFIRGTCSFVEKSRNAQERGAIAVIIANNQANELNFPIIMGGDGFDVSIPVMMTDYDDGQTLINNAAGLRVSVGKDTNLQLGEFNNGTGRGATDTLFSFYVPQAGVYPFRCTYQQGGGGANVEWFTVTEDGTKILVNDTVEGAILAYRARTFTPPLAVTGVGLNFGADEAGGALVATDVAGAPGVAQANWNNLNALSGSSSALVGDAAGTAQEIATTVEWTSNGTWASTGRGEENNALTGANRTLMTGYLDTGADTTSTVTLSALPEELTEAEYGYDVYVYGLGGVAGRGGSYRMVDPFSGAVLRSYIKAQSPENPTEHVMVPTTDPNAWGAGTYLVFRNLEAGSIRIEATTVDPWGFGSPNRAPINAVQLVPATEPPPSAKFNIAWVSFHPADDTPSTAAADAGFTRAPDAGYTDLLEAAGHTVTRIVSSGTPDAGLLNTFDLVIISRSVPSGHYQDANAGRWNAIQTPIIVMGGYAIRQNRMGYTTGNTIPDTDRPVSLRVNDPGHPVFAGIALDAQNIMVNGYAGIVTFNELVQRGISVNTDPVAGDGTVLAVIDTEGDPANNGMIVGEWQAGATMGNTAADTLGGHRLVLLSGSREQGITSEGAGIYDLTEDGARILLNAVGYMAVPKTLFAPPVIADGNITITWSGAGELQTATSIAGPWSGTGNTSGSFTEAVGAGNKYYRVQRTE